MACWVHAGKGTGCLDAGSLLPYAERTPALSGERGVLSEVLKVQ